MPLNGVLIPPAGVSDFSLEGERTLPYTSYYYSNQTYSEYLITPETHQAVLNEVAARPSNFGYGLGYALNSSFHYISDQLKRRRNLQTYCMSEDKGEEPLINYGIGAALKRIFNFISSPLTPPKSQQPSCMPTDKAAEIIDTKIHKCIESTTKFQQSLAVVEKAEETHLDCLLNNGINPQEARLEQQSQRPTGLQTHSTLFPSVGAGPYRTRKLDVCKEEAIQSMKDVREAEWAEGDFRRDCGVYKSVNDELDQSHTPFSPKYT